MVLLIHAAFSAPLAGTVAGLTGEGLVTPELVDPITPRLSWQRTLAKRGARQSASQRRVLSLDAPGAPAPVLQDKLGTGRKLTAAEADFSWPKKGTKSSDHAG